MLIVDTITIEMITTDVLIIITEIEDMTQMDVAAVVVMMIVAVIYVLCLYVTHAANAVEEIYVLVSRR